MSQKTYSEEEKRILKCLNHSLEKDNLEKSIRTGKNTELKIQKTQRKGKEKKVENKKSGFSNSSEYRAKKAVKELALK